ncbi:hypothetical protein CLOBOL_02986 [Enterocloster bolteae ATCC BAA-613]|uniref:Uncharacterized protein n=1 Tax=Enterocloster bolteae (strain ATCC BAA-613 / DSM 15670 / CCUG 46953 / JCM 12243 / WAL 16351) TaxID=411902 RepID=A8RRE7_ENTBW|nr:hypothetical protein CLOBOL_02986 [Enterocloster bolteae ATCC BAA-613]
MPALLFNYIVNTLKAVSQRQCGLGIFNLFYFLMFSPPGP